MHICAQFLPHKATIIHMLPINSFNCCLVIMRTLGSARPHRATGIRTGEVAAQLERGHATGPRGARRRPSDSTTSMPMSAWLPLLGGFQHHHFGALLRRRILWPTEPTVICRRCWYWEQSKMRTLHVLMLSTYVATAR